MRIAQKVLDDVYKVIEDWNSSGGRGMGMYIFLDCHKKPYMESCMDGVDITLEDVIEMKDVLQRVEGMLKCTTQT